ncbi:MAG TPA: hypothetical protein VKF14_10905 [Candidatus Dormibacteraeota bacterium]|nr:hypothetical protein [Candidatus Dormibacteraeota bacterium]
MCKPIQELAETLIVEARSLRHHLSCALSLAWGEQTCEVGREIFRERSGRLLVGHRRRTL